MSLSPQDSGCFFFFWGGGNWEVVIDEVRVDAWCAFHKCATKALSFFQMTSTKVQQPPPTFEGAYEKKGEESRGVLKIRGSSAWGFKDFLFGRGC